MDALSNDAHVTWNGTDLTIRPGRVVRDLMRKVPMHIPVPVIPRESIGAVEVQRPRWVSRGQLVVTDAGGGPLVSVRFGRRDAAAFYALAEALADA